MRRLLALLLLLVFATLATADGVSCPDGCRSSQSSDRCQMSGSCAFCNGGFVTLIAAPAVRPVLAALPAPEADQFDAPMRSSPAVERPPRLV